VKPGPEGALSPYQFVLIPVDGEKIDLKVFGVDWGANFPE
jgi:hypothetical protein